MMYGLGIGLPFQLAPLANILSVLAKYGANVHVWCSGLGVVNGLTAANYLDSALTTPSTLDNPVAGVVDSFGAVNAIQPTAGSRPVLRRGAVNLLTYSQDFSNAAWVPNAQALNSTYGFSDPAGGLTASKWVPTTANAVHRQSRGTTVTNGTAYTGVVVLKAAGYNYFGLKSGISGQNQPVFDLSSGTVVEGVGSITPLGGGWFLCAHTVVPNTGIYFDYWTPLNSAFFAAESYAGDGVSGTYVAGAALFQGTYTAAKIKSLGGIPLTTTAPASTALGPYFYECNGGNSLLTSAGTAASGFFVVGLTASALTYATPFGSIDASNLSGQAGIGLKLRNDGSAWLRSQNGDGAAGDNSSIQVPGYYSAGIPFVAAATWAYPGTQTFWKDGVSVGSQAIAAYSPVGALGPNLGAGLLGAEPLVGNMHAAIWGAGSITNADLVTLQNWVATCQGRSI